MEAIATRGELLDSLRQLVHTMPTKLRLQSLCLVMDVKRGGCFGVTFEMNADDQVAVQAAVRNWFFQNLAAIVEGRISAVVLYPAIGEVQIMADREEEQDE